MNQRRPWVHLLAIAPIPVLAAAIVALWVADVQVAWSSTYVNGFVHYGSAVLGIVLIVIPAARSFVASGQPSVLMLGCGVLMTQIGAAIMPTPGLDAGFAIYNTCALLSALCHFTGVAIASRRKIRLDHAARWLTAGYAGVLATMALITWAAFAGRMPHFFIDGQGGTLLRSLVVSAAAALFLLTAGLLWQTNRRAASPFLFWYALGLVLVAVGLAGSISIPMRDCPLQWVTRSTQILGMVYMCVAALASTRESRAMGSPLAAVEEAWRSNAFLPNLRQRTLLAWATRYGLAIGAVAAAFGLRLALTAWVGAGLATYLTFYPAVMAVALLAGFGPGLLATALAAFAAGCWILPPVGQLAIASPVDRLGLAIFVGMGLFMSVVAELYRRGRAKAAAYDRDVALRASREALHESEERYRNLFNTMDEGFCIVEMIFDEQDRPVDYRFLKVNLAFERQTGLHHAGGKRMRELAPAHEAHWFEIYGKVAATGESVRFVNQARALNRWFDVCAYRVGEPEDRQVAIVFNDISDYKQAEAALRQKEAELKEAQRIAHVGNWYWDKTTDVTTGSDELLRIYGFDPATERMPDFREQRGRCYPVEDWERVNAAVQWTVQTGLGYELEVRAIRGDAPIWIMTRGEAAVDAAGQIVGLRGTVQDITERKRAEDAARESQRQNEFLAGILQRASQAFGVGYPDGRLGLINAAFETLTGYTGDELRSIDWAKTLTPPEWRPIERTTLEDLHRTGEPARYEKEYVRKDGSRVPIELLVHLVKDEQAHPLYYFSFINDITERKCREERIAKLTRLYAMLSQVNEAIVRAHDAESLYCDVCRIVAEMGGVPLAWIGQAQGRRVVPLAWSGSAADYAQEIRVEVQGELGGGPTGTCIRENRTVVNDDFATSPATAPWREAAERYGFRASAAFPLRRQGKAIGALTLYACEPNAFDAEQVSLLESLCADISFALDAFDHDQVRVHAEQALRESESRYRNLFTTMSEGFALHELICDADGKPCDYRFLEVNPAFEQATGLKAADVVGRTLREALPGSEPVWVQRYGRVVLTGEPDHFEDYHRPTGHWYEVYASRTAPGQFAVVFLNVTDRKQAEDALQATLQRFYVVLSNMYSGVLLVTDEGRVEFANQAICDRFGLDDSPTDLMGLGSPDVLEKIKNAYLHPDEAVARIREIVDRGQPVSSEEVAMRDGGSCLRDFIPLNVHGKSYGRLWHHVDITDRKRVEDALLEAKAAAEAANTAKSQFLANMSHELRTPMNAILGMIDMALPKVIDPTVNDCLQTAKGSADLLLALLNDLLESARIESGKLELESAPFSLRRMLDQITRILSVQASENGLSFCCRMSEGTPDVVVGDRMRLQQILLNLAGNAIKFTERGEVEISLRTVEGSEGGTPSATFDSSHRIPNPQSPIPSVGLEFAVRDTGIGIPTAAQERLFQPFAQADASMARRFGGSGLGLSICKNLVEMMGGRIWVESEVGQGSTFHVSVRLPLAKELPAEPTARGFPALAASTLRILLVEDNPANQKLAAYILEERGHSVEIASDGYQAIRMAEENSYDVILMDLQMPGMDGAEATKAIRAGEDGQARVPIIAMTAHAMASDRQRCLASGMDGYLSKPIDAHEMIALVENLAAGAAADNAGAASETSLPAEPEEPSTSVVFDPGLALQRCLGRPDLLQQILGFFCKDASNFLPQMRAALQKGDLAEVGRLGHQLKGTLGHIAAEPARAAAERVERFLLHPSDQAEAEEAVTALERECKILIAVLTEHQTTTNPAQGNP